MFFLIFFFNFTFWEHRYIAAKPVIICHSICQVSHKKVPLFWWIDMWYISMCTLKDNDLKTMACQEVCASMVGVMVFLDRFKSGYFIHEIISDNPQKLSKTLLRASILHSDCFYTIIEWTFSFQMLAFKVLHFFLFLS